MDGAPSNRPETAPIGGSATAIDYRPFVFYGGNCRDAFTRYHEILGGDLALLRLADAPSEEPVPPEQADLIIHACQELVELITDYLDGVLPPVWRAGLQDHLSVCDGCSEYTRQLRFTIEALKGLAANDDPDRADDHR